MSPSDTDTKTVLVEGGILWGDLVNALLPQSLVPPVLTNNLNVTVSGTLSVAGLGVASHRYGTQADQCVELEVVTGTGELTTCSAQQNSTLFDAVRAGFGQFGIIVEAKLRVRRAKSHFRTHFLLYDDITKLMKDARLVIEESRFDFIESWAAPCPQGFRKTMMGRQPFAAWFYPLHLTEEFDPSAPLKSEEKLAGLSYYQKVHVEEGPLKEFLFRLEDLFALWKRAGYWDACHPWIKPCCPGNQPGLLSLRSCHNFRRMPWVGDTYCFGHAEGMSPRSHSFRSPNPISSWVLVCCQVCRKPFCQRRCLD